MNAPLIIAIIVVAAVVAVVIAWNAARFHYEHAFRDWQSAAQEEWENERTAIRKSAINQSRSVLGGKFTEQLAPYLPEFRYDPTEARFVGNPIDLVVFPGLATGNPREIVIVEIKSGKTGALSPVEKKIQQLVEDGMVRWELLHLPNVPGQPPND